jgi:hypothetical protein
MKPTKYCLKRGRAEGEGLQEYNREGELVKYSVHIYGSVTMKPPCKLMSPLKKKRKSI